MPKCPLQFHMQTVVMIKGLPRAFNLHDFQKLLAETGLYAQTISYNIPGSVWRRRKETTGPLAYAFAEFETPEMAHHAWKTLWEYNVWDEVEYCFRPISTSFGITKTVTEPPPEDSPEPTSEKKRMAMDPSQKKTDEQDTSTHQADASEKIQTKQSTTAAKKHNTNQQIQKWDSYAANKWQHDSHQNQWDTTGRHSDCASWWDGSYDMVPVTNDVDQLFVHEGNSSSVHGTGYACPHCHQSFIRFSQCKHHYQSVCKPIGEHPSEYDDDVVFQQVCRGYRNFVLSSGLLH